MFSLYNCLFPDWKIAPPPVRIDGDQYSVTDECLFALRYCTHVKNIFLRCLKIDEKKESLSDIIK